MFTLYMFDSEYDTLRFGVNVFDMHEATVAKLSSIHCEDELILLNQRNSRHLQI